MYSLISSLDFSPSSTWLPESGIVPECCVTWAAWVPGGTCVIEATCSMFWAALTCSTSSLAPVTGKVDDGWVILGKLWIDFLCLAPTVASASVVGWRFPLSIFLSCIIFFSFHLKWRNVMTLKPNKKVPSQCTVNLNLRNPYTQSWTETVGGFELWVVVLVQNILGSPKKWHSSYKVVNLDQYFIAISHTISRFLIESHQNYGITPYAEPKNPISYRGLC